MRSRPTRNKNCELCIELGYYKMINKKEALAVIKVQSIVEW